MGNAWDAAKLVLGFIGIALLIVLVWGALQQDPPGEPCDPTTEVCDEGPFYPGD